VHDGQPAACWRSLNTRVRIVKDGRSGRDVGITVLGLSVIDVDETPELWGRPRFDVPILGLTGASVGEIILAARALFGARSSVSRAFLLEAADAAGEEAIELWRCCLEPVTWRRTMGWDG
jgi:hypothetical protein